MINEEKLLEEVHKEEDGGDFAIDAFSFSNGRVVGVANGAVGLDFPDGSVVGISNGAIGFDLADGGVVGVADGAVGLDLADAGVVGVADGAVRLNFADGGVVSVADGAVALNFSDGSIVGVAKGLGFEGGRHEQQEGEEEGNNVFHRSGWVAIYGCMLNEKTRQRLNRCLRRKDEVEPRFRSGAGNLIWDRAWW